MAAKFDQNDDSVVVIVGSGAGGGTLGNELAQKGVKVVVLEAGKRYRIRGFHQRRVGRASPSSPGRTCGRPPASWRVHKDFPNLPAWIVKAVGGTSTHWAGASLRFQEHEFKDASTYGHIPGANLLDWPLTLAELEPYYAKAEDKMGVTRTNGLPGLPGNNNFKVFKAGRRQARLQGVPHRPDGDQFGRARRPQFLPADRILLPGLQVGGEMVDALHRDPQGRGDRQHGGSPGVACRADRARRLGQGHRRDLFRRRRQAAAAEGAHRRGRGQFARKPAPSAQLRFVEIP